MGQINVTGSVGAAPPPPSGDAQTFTGTSVTYTAPGAGTDVTFNFASSVTYGYYWNGEPFVVSGGDTDIVITSISPASRSAYGRAVVDGATVQPRERGLGLSFDSGNYQFTGTYNDDPGYTGQNLTIAASTYPTGASLVKAISRVTPTQHNWLSELVTLTVVPSVPPANAFRPPIIGYDKTSHYTTADVNMDLLKSTTLVTGHSSPTGWPNYIGRTIQSWRGTPWTARSTHPTLYHNGYNAYQKNTYAYMLMALHGNYPVEDKRPLANTLVQYGLDYISLVDIGPNETYGGGEAHNDDAKLVSAFAAAMLEDVNLRPSNLQGRFAEDIYVYTLESGDLNTDYHYASSNNFPPGTGAIYYDDFLGAGEWQFFPRTDPDVNALYRWIHHQTVALQALGMDMIGTGEGRAAWENDAFFDLGARIWHMQRVNRTVGDGIHTIAQNGVDFLAANYATYTDSGTIRPEPPFHLTVSASGTTATVTFPTDALVGSGTLSRRDVRWSTDRVNWTTITNFTSGGTITGLPSGSVVYIQGRYVTDVGTGPWSTNQIKDRGSTIATATGTTYGTGAFQTACRNVYEAASGFEALCATHCRGVVRT